LISDLFLKLVLHLLNNLSYNHKDYNNHDHLLIIFIL